MVFNLIHEKWIWVKRQDGKRELIAPWEITDQLDSNPIVSLDAARADFNGSMIQFLIGLVQTTMSPKNEKGWREQFINPPTVDELKETFDGVSSAFNLDGENERFMQDYEHIEEFDKCKHINVSRLLIETPGENTITNNIDHFVKRGTVSQMCFSCCATALFTLQVNAPQGGKGYLTSLRGGGPLTTVVLGDTLWQTIWLNVIVENNFENLGNNNKNKIEEIFPWMGPTRTTGKKQIETSPMDVNPKQMYWGMPRRKRIDFEKLEKGYCDVCGCKSDELVESYFRKTYGNDYNNTWCHVLTPYTHNKNGLIPKHLSENGIYYRHWLGLVQSDSENGEFVSKAVDNYWKKQSDILNYGVLKNSPRLWAFGYDVKGNDARCWYESTVPLFNVSEHIMSNYEFVVSQLIKTAEFVGKNTYKCIKQALYSKEQLKNSKKFSSFDNWIDSRFCQETESEFYNILNKLISELEHDSEVFELKTEWIKILAYESEKLFDEYSQSSQLATINPKRVAIARKYLRINNSNSTIKKNNLINLP